MSGKPTNDIRPTMRRLGICVVVPTYNNDGTLRDVLERLLSLASDIIVVNDGSTDSTADLLDRFKDRITVVTHTRNRGKGHALRTGFRTARSLGYRYAVTIDSDGQHYPEDLPGFVRAIAEYPGALVVGKRDLTDVDINGKSSFANKFSNFWFHVQTGRRLDDTQTGYRAYPLDRLHGLGLLTSRYEAELELLVFSAWGGVPIEQIPIRVYYPPQSERVSHFRPVPDFTRISILNTLLCGGAILYGVPSRIIHAVADKRIFNREFRRFTLKKDIRKEAASTLGRITRSIYGISYFTFWSAAVLSPLSSLYFKIFPATEERKLKLHRLLCWSCRRFTKRFPGATTRIDNPTGESFERPALIICNHQSHLDLPILISVHPKLIFLTNDWVWNNKTYGTLIHNAEYLPVSAGIDAIMPQLRDLRDRGYSIVVFPEGTRSADCSILRFHQGAFLLARELGMDIVPMTLHGAGHYLPKEDFMFRRGVLTLRILPRVPYDPSNPMTLREEASHYRRMIREEYARIVTEVEDADYFESFVRYKYAWRGWQTVSRAKRTLRELRKMRPLIADGKKYRRVRIINSGLGTFAMLYALVNKETEIYAYERYWDDHLASYLTGGMPANLHFIHPIWEEDFGTDEDFDLTIHLDSEEEVLEHNLIKLKLKS